ncbi:HTH-type transcriptional activator Btr [compost metagenome]
MKTTLEHIAEVNPDILFLMICQETRSIEYWKRLQRDNQWQNLDAVRNHRVVQIPSDPWKEYSPVGLERTLTGATQFLMGLK